MSRGRARRRLSSRSKATRRARSLRSRSDRRKVGGGGTNDNDRTRKCAIAAAACLQRRSAFSAPCNLNMKFGSLQSVATVSGRWTISRRIARSRNSCKRRARVRAICVRTAAARDLIHHRARARRRLAFLVCWLISPRTCARARVPLAHSSGSRCGRRAKNCCLLAAAAADMTFGARNCYLKAQAAANTAGAH